MIPYALKKVFSKDDISFACSPEIIKRKDIQSNIFKYKTITVLVTMRLNGEMIVKIYRPGIAFFLNIIGISEYFKGRVDEKSNLIYGIFCFNLFSKLFVVSWLSFILFLNALAVIFAIGAILDIRNNFITLIVACVFPPVSYTFIKLVNSMIRSFEEEKEILKEFILGTFSE